MISRRVRAFQKPGQPVVSVDTKKKEPVGLFRNGGRDWHPRGRPVAVNVHDFPDPEPGKAIPYGVHGMTASKGWASVGITGDTAEFAAGTIRRRWRRMGSPLYPDARRLPVTADGGGPDGSRNRLWKLEIQRLADGLGLAVPVCHFPPGTSNKWNRIGHRMFCHITRNWRGKPPVSHEVIVNLISATGTKAGLSIRSGIDDNGYATGIKVTDDQMEALSIRRTGFHGEWNYTLLPRI